MKYIKGRGALRFGIYDCTFQMIKRMSREEKGRLLEHICRYVEEGDNLDKSGDAPLEALTCEEEDNIGVRIIFDEWKDYYDHDEEERKRVCRKRSAAGQKGMQRRWHPTKTNDNDVTAEDNNVTDEYNTVIADDNTVITENNNVITDNNNVTTDDNNVTADDNIVMENITGVITAIRKKVTKKKKIRTLKKKLLLTENQRKKFLCPSLAPPKSGCRNSTSRWCRTPANMTVRCSTTSTNTGRNWTNDGAECASRCRKPGKSANGSPSGHESHSDKAP